MDQAKIGELRSAVQDLVALFPAELKFGSDWDYQRWINGYDGDTKTIIPMLRRSLRLLTLSYKEFPLSAVDYRKIQSYVAFCSPEPPVFSKAGYVLHVDFVGKADYKAIFDSGALSWHTFLQYRIKLTEELLFRAVRQREKETGKQSGVYAIWDLKGLSKMGFSNIVNHMLPLFRSMNEFLCNNYIEILQKLSIINAPSGVNQLWSLIRPFLPAKTRDKIRFVSDLSVIAADFDPDSLPDFYGGNLKVDENNQNVYNLPNAEQPDWVKKMSNDPKLQQHNVPYAKSLIFHFQIEKPGPHSLKLKLVATNSFNFGIFHSEKGVPKDVNADRMVFPYYMPFVASELSPFIHTLALSEPGFYAIRIDNYHTWLLSSLTVHAEVCLNGPDGKVLTVKNELM